MEGVHGGRRPAAGYRRVAVAGGGMEEGRGGRRPAAGWRRAAAGCASCPACPRNILSFFVAFFLFRLWILFLGCWLPIPIFVKESQKVAPDLICFQFLSMKT
jgi:hypothetical protein